MNTVEKMNDKVEKEKDTASTHDDHLLEQDINSMKMLVGKMEHIITQPKENGKKLESSNTGKEKVTKKDQPKRIKKVRPSSMDSDSIQKITSNAEATKPLTSKKKGKNTSASVEMKTGNDISKSEHNVTKFSPNVKQKHAKVNHSDSKVTKFKPPTEKDLNDPKFESTLERFKTYQTVKNNKIQEMKRKMQDEEEKKLTKVPELNSKSKQIGQTHEAFLSRMKKYQESSESKKKAMIQTEQKKKEEEEQKILTEMNKKNQIKLENKDIIKKIEGMMDWESKRQKKINEMKVSEVKKLQEECKFKPEIDKNSNKIAGRKDIMQGGSSLTVDRLYKQDVIKRKQKQEMLEDVYLPSFVPVTNGSKSIDANDKISAHPNGFNVNYMTHKDNTVEEMLKERVKMIRKKQFTSELD